MMLTEPLVLIVYGATGFTGELVAVASLGLLPVALKASLPNCPLNSGIGPRPSALTSMTPMR